MLDPPIFKAGSCQSHLQTLHDLILAARKLRSWWARCCGPARSSQPGHGRRHRRPRPNIGGLTFWLILAPGYGGGTARNPG